LAEAVFAANDNAGPAQEMRCPNCNMLMAGATEIIVAYRDFMREVTRQKRGARFRANLKI
jgi:hypothetical protein